MKATVEVVFGIIELHEHVCLYLNPHEFVACVQVNRSFSNLFLPFLWEVVNLFPSIESIETNHFILTSDLFLNEYGRAATLKNAHWIKTFKTEDPGLVACLPQSCTNLVRLCVGNRENFKQTSIARQSVTPEVQALIERNPGVKRFRMDNIDTEINVFMSAVAMSFPVLDSLTLGITKIQLAQIVAPGGFLDSCPSTLRKLTLTFTAMMPGVAELDTPGNVAVSSIQSAQAPPVAPVRYLKMENFNTFANIQLIQLVRRLRNLESLHLDNQIFDKPVVLFANALAHNCPRLQHLNLFESTCHEEWILVALLKASVKGWKTIKAPHSVYLGPQSLDVLLGCSTSTLTSLTYERYNSLRANHVRHLLDQARNLETLQLDVWCSADTVIQSPAWACAQTLSTLRIIMNRIPRPDIKENHYKRHLGDEPLHHGDSMEESRKLQKRVYTRLGSLTQIEELVLGTEYDEYHWAERPEGGLTSELGVRVNGYQYECLEFTLQSGLAEMAGLKRLKRLDLTRMSHRIRVPELNWMMQHWPQLESIVDLFPPGDERDSDVVAWLKDNNRPTLAQYSNSSNLGGEE
ncbi:hypothetical protein BG004_002176 [Podila humilis]|nr:hypothetical protein BG004_002176 [Podila humilis]